MKKSQHSKVSSNHGGRGGVNDELTDFRSKKTQIKTASENRARAAGGKESGRIHFTLTSYI